MKKLLYTLLIFSVFFASCKKDEDETETTITVSMEAGQTNDVYYSFIDGEVSSVNRSDWDLAFSVPLRTATILINEGAGVYLFMVGDTTTWESVDTTGMASWLPLYNDKSDWMRGAFNLDADGGFDFGWAIYDHANTHNVWGLYVYVIKLSNGSYKKLFIRKRIGSTDTYVLRWADIDGSNQIDATFSPAAYAGAKHFIHYSLVDEDIVEAEPDNDTWDLLFTRYIEKIPTGPDSEMDYPVMGVLINKDLKALKLTGIDPAVAHYSDASGSFTNQADIIGWDWKIQDPVTHEISIAENTSYFVKLLNDEIYKIYFTEYTGVATGSITIRQQKIE
ncbi:hypothetical protein ES703_76576 [subsurface metagenome]